MSLRSWFAGRGGPERERERLAKRYGDGPLGAYLATPFATDDTAVEDLRLLAVDLETTGLDPRSDHALSVGFVPVDGLRVDLAGARHLVIRVPAEVGQSATVHGLTDDAVAALGVPPEEALAAVLEALRGRVLLAHYATIETSFLAASTQRVLGTSVPVVSVDTLDLERRLTTRWNEEPRAGSLRLWAARSRHGLPTYRAHDALVDALACAELYLAQVAELGADGDAVTLGRLRA